MISFLYQGHTYYANVMIHSRAPLRYHISIINSPAGLAKDLILLLSNVGFELSLYSPGLADKELIDAIASKLPTHYRADADVA